MSSGCWARPQRDESLCGVLLLRCRRQIEALRPALGVFVGQPRAEVDAPSAADVADRALCVIAARARLHSHQCAHAPRPEVVVVATTFVRPVLQRSETEGDAEVRLSGSAPAEMVGAYSSRNFFRASPSGMVG